MTARRDSFRLAALLPALALAAYSVVGVFGHALHWLLPCEDGHCGVFAAAADAHACCCHHHDAAQGASESEGPKFRAAGHDADDCSLCLLLVQIKSGHATILTADFSAERSAALLASPEPCAAVDKLLALTARGPPAC
jgi:hypothetical protein